MQCFSYFFTTLLFISLNSVNIRLTRCTIHSKLYYLAFQRHRINYDNNLLRCMLYCFGIVYSCSLGAKMTFQFVLLYLLRQCQNPVTKLFLYILYSIIVLENSCIFSKYVKNHKYSLKYIQNSKQLLNYVKNHKYSLK